MVSPTARTMFHIARTLDALEAFPSTLRAFLDDVSEGALDWRPDSWDGIPSETLTIRQQVCHVRDIEADGYLVRVDRLMRETEPVLQSIDTYALVESRGYDRTDVREALAAFTEARRRMLALLADLDQRALSRRGTFEGYGPVTLKGLIHFLCSHDQQHLAGVQWLIAQHESRA
jgi:DinB superfamily